MRYVPHRYVSPRTLCVFSTMAMSILRIPMRSVTLERVRARATRQSSPGPAGCQQTDRQAWARVQRCGAGNWDAVPVPTGSPCFAERRAVSFSSCNVFLRRRREPSSGKVEEQWEWKNHGPNYRAPIRAAAGTCGRVVRTGSRVVYHGRSLASQSRLGRHHCNNGLSDRRQARGGPVGVEDDGGKPALGSLSVRAPPERSSQPQEEEQMRGAEDPYPLDVSSPEDRRLHADRLVAGASGSPPIRPACQNGAPPSLAVVSLR